MINEVAITEYRLFYQQLLPLKGNRHTVVRSLQVQLEKLTPFIESMQKQQYFPESAFQEVVKETAEFVRKIFPATIYLKYSSTPGENNAFESSGDFVKDFLAISIRNLIDKNKRFPLKKVNEYSFRLNFLRRIHSCLKDFGLHNYIQERDKSSLRYNVLIEHDMEKGQKNIEVICLVSLEKIKTSFVAPFHANEPILINGARIPAKHNKRITFTSTKLKDEEIPNFKDKYGCRTPEQFAKACSDETNVLLDGPLILANQATKVGGVPFIGQLLSNLNVSEIVVDAYCSLMRQPQGWGKIPAAYCGKLEQYNDPFRICYLGAYPLMADWEFLQKKIDKGYYAAHNVTKEEIDKYLQLYANAFVDGYHLFEEDILKNKTIIFNEPFDKSQAIFDYATGNFFRGGGFPERMGGGQHILSAWPEAGKEAGYFYKAWYIILEYSKRFEPLFKKENKDMRDEFLDKFIRGIDLLQTHDTTEDFIIALKNGKKKDEAKFRNWFRNYFAGADYKVDPESLTGQKRIDLKLTDLVNDRKIIEFKGWWNFDRHTITMQIIGYLNDFDHTGYILMVDHLKRGNIIGKYKDIITSARTGYIAGSWKEISYRTTGFTYFYSEHKTGKKVKRIYHFIYSVYRSVIERYHSKNVAIKKKTQLSN